MTTSPEQHISLLLKWLGFDSDHHAFSKNKIQIIAGMKTNHLRQISWNRAYPKHPTSEKEQNPTKFWCNHL